MASSTSCLSLTAWILFAVLLQILGLTLFVVGFFPIKPSLPGKSGPESYRMPTCNAAVDAEEVDLPPDQLRSMYEELSGLPTSFDRLILMVIDGLPAEFVLGRGDLHPSKAMMEAMPYTQSLLSQGLAIAYHAKAAPPTVTMPRLKAMVSGAIGGFLDVAFNFNTQAFLDDNLLDQLYRVGWNLVMLGDETWIKLFPSLFSRQDGVSSFYVKDTVEVDYNVTRHLKVELAAIDWGLLILHYLGLDHVGHIGGRSSVLMASKLNEMDGIIKMICEQVLSQDVDRKTLLLVVSDHGMTESGNHGGSTHEETDSLALFIGLRPEQPHYAPSLHNKVLQVDIAPTLALLFGVPIPRNNVGVVLIDIFDTLTDEQKLRALELNSWQLLRLLQAHIPGLCYESFPDGAIDEHHVQINQSVLSDKEKFSQLYLKAMIAHNLWRTQQCSGLLSNSTHEMRLAVESYDDFLGNASEWLSHRATDKPIKLLVSGICIMFMSCVLLIHLFICLSEEVYSTLKQHSCQQKRHGSRWYSHEAFICFGVLAHIISLGASSMVEEEQYTWHFLASTLYLLFLFTIVHSLMCLQTSDSSNIVKGEDNVLHQFQRFANARNFIWFADFKTSERIKICQLVQICSVVLVLICGRILRGWHQGGINWIHLPDISKWLEQSGAFTIKLLQIASLVLVMIISSVALYLVRTNRKLVFRLFCSYFASGFLVLLYIVKNESHEVGPMGFYATLIAQIFYVSIVVMVFFVLFALPWILPLLHCQETPKMIEPKSDSYSLDMHNKFHLLDNIRDATYLTGVTYCVCWCLLQLLLQQPVNAMPVALIFLQLLGSMVYFSADISPHRQLIEVAAIYFLGMAGHFGLGNSNSLATIDVAGAFIGISSHSTILSGILMFIITYASPLLSFLSVVINTATKEIGRLPNQHKLELGCILRVMIGIPCLLPVVFNSILLNGFTITLLSMRNHLFVWSVFSPKYLYVCAATLSVYIGVCILASTGVYICSVFFYRTKMLR